MCFGTSSKYLHKQEEDLYRLHASCMRLDKEKKEFLIIFLIVVISVKR